MSSSPIGLTSTTASSSASRSPGAERPLAVIACGALSAELRRVAEAAGVPVEVHTLSSLLHNRPEMIAPAVEALASSLMADGREVAVAYADCGTYGALDTVCARLGLERLPGAHCYDLVGGERLVRDLLDEEPGTYLLTDFLVSNFHRLVAVSLGLDRHPELVADYFANYRRAVWLTSRPSPRLAAKARHAASVLSLPLETRLVGSSPVSSVLVDLVARVPVR